MEKQEEQAKMRKKNQKKKKTLLSLRPRIQQTTNEIPPLRSGNNSLFKKFEKKMKMEKSFVCRTAGLLRRVCADMFAQHSSFLFENFEPH